MSNLTDRLEKAIDKGTVWEESVELVMQSVKEIAELEAELAAYRWIPVSEQLPGNQEDVWAYTSGRECWKAFPTGIKGDWRACVDNEYQLEVTHWMPIPPLPSQPTETFSADDYKLKQKKE